MQKVLARGITALCALAALAAASPALGGDPEPSTYSSSTYSSSFGFGGTISFQREKANHNQRVHDIEINAIGADCEGRAGELNYTILGTTKVLDDRSFAVRSKDASGKGKAIVRGEFSRKFKRAKGSARVYGKFLFQDGWSKCESGKQKFVATVSG